jgi:hypothetical protein
MGYVPETHPAQRLRLACRCGKRKAQCHPQHRAFRGADPEDVDVAPTLDGSFGGARHERGLPFGQGGLT